MLEWYKIRYKLNSYYFFMIYRYNHYFYHYIGNKVKKLKFSKLYQILYGSYWYNSKIFSENFSSIRAFLQKLWQKNCNFMSIFSCIVKNIKMHCFTITLQWFIWLSWFFLWISYNFTSWNNTRLGINWTTFIFWRYIVKSISLSIYSE